MKKPVSMIPVCIALRVAAHDVQCNTFDHHVALLEAMGNIQDEVERMKATLTACVEAHDHHIKLVGLDRFGRHEDPSHIAAARQLLANLG